MSDLKVLGCKVKESLYDEFRSLDGSVSANLRAAIENHLKQSNETQLTPVNHEKNIEEYKHITNKQKRVLVAQYQNILKKISDDETYILKFEKIIKNNDSLFFYRRLVGLDFRILKILQEIVSLQSMQNKIIINDFQPVQKNDNPGLDEKDNQTDSNWEGA